MVRVNPSLYEGREGVFSHWVGRDRGGHFLGGNFCLCFRKMRGFQQTQVEEQEAPLSSQRSGLASSTCCVEGGRSHEA